MEDKIMLSFFKKKKTAFMPLYEKITDGIVGGKMLTPKGDRYAKFTGYNYKSSAYRFRLWEQENGTIYLEDINLEWAHKFAAFLMERGYCKNSISQSLGRLKTVLRRLRSRGMDVYDGLGIHTGSDMVTTVYSTIEDLKKMLQLDLSETPGLERVRDIYVLQCFVGLRYSDLAQVLRDPAAFLRDIGHKLYFDVKTKKTGEVVVIPVARVVKQILDKYSCNFGKPFSYQYYNDTIKLVAERAGITDTIIFTRTEGGVRVDTPRLKWALMSSHTARRTFATNAFLAGLPERSIMSITGHRTTQAFTRYIRCSNLDAAIRIANHDFFNIDLDITFHLPDNHVEVLPINSNLPT